MAELPPTEDVDDALAAEREAIRALKRAPPGETVEQARLRSCKLIEAQSRRIAASRRTVAAAVTPKHGAQPVGVVATDSDELIDAVVRGTARFVKATVKPLKERLAKLEQLPRPEGAGTLKAEWVCKDNTGDTGLRCDECGSCGPRMRPGPTLLSATWLAVARWPGEFLCDECVLQRCRSRLGRELKAGDLRGSDDNRAWLAALKERSNG